MARPDLRASGATGFPTTELFDRGELGQRRVMAPSSAAVVGQVWEDTADARPDLEAEAEKIQASGELADISTMLAFEWIEGAPELTDTIGEIGGIYYSLSLSRGAERVPPRVVSRTLDLGNWSCQVHLGTERKSGTTFRPARLAPGPLGGEGWMPE